MRTYHWVIALRFNGGLEVGNEGLVVAGPEATRRSLFNEIVAAVKQKAGRDTSDSALVLNFVLQQNDLEPGPGEVAPRGVEVES